MNRFVAGILVLALAATARPAAAAGDIDPAYGQGGWVAGEALPLADGRALRWQVNAAQYQRVDADGQPDGGFGTDGSVAWPAGFIPNTRAWLRLPDGGLLLGGRRQYSAALVHLLPSGDLDTSFGEEGILAWEPKVDRSQVDGLVAHPDGRILVLIGEYFAASYMDRPALGVVICLDSSLASVDTFGDGGELMVADYRLGSGYIESYAFGLAVLPDGLIAFVDDYPGTAFPYPKVEYFDIEGRPVAAPAFHPALESGIRHWRVLHRYPDGSMLVDGSRPVGRYSVYRALADGRPDAAFGDAGRLDELLSTPPEFLHVSADGAALYLAYGSVVKRFILQGPEAGRIDLQFGQRGMVNLKLGLGVVALHETPDGSLLVAANPPFPRERGMVRLTASAQGPGLVGVPGSYINAGISGSTVTVRVVRAGGSSGAASVDYATYAPFEDSSTSGVPGSDYAFVSGRLEWADGDSEDKLVTIPILPAASERDSGRIAMYIGLRLENPQGALLFGSSTMIYVTGRLPLAVSPQPTGADPAPAPSPPTGADPAPAPSPPRASPRAPAPGAGQVVGGGALDLVALPVLLMLVAWRMLAASGDDHAPRWRLRVMSR